MPRLPSAIASRSLLPVLLLVSAVACGDEDGNACDDYVDYMCDCHGDEYSCEDLENTYDNPDSDLQDDCKLALDDQEAEDAETGHECVADTGTSA